MAPSNPSNVAPIAFGTAGLRGPVGPGVECMNEGVILRVSWALARFLEESGLANRPIVIGYDGRAPSAGWARLAAEVHQAAGQEAWLLPLAGPTPWVAFGVRHFRAAAGVVLTPSHNPRGDAGYKLFDSEGVQIIAPWDTRIAELMSQAPPLEQIARSQGKQFSCPAELWGAYDAWLDELAARVRGGAASKSLALAYTPLHGVGFEAADNAARRQGATLIVVPEQKEPDSDFPTTPFPNPEEAGALDLVLALAGERGLELAAANDPDADRFALAVAENEGGSLRPLSGDQLGLLLADIWLEACAVPQPLVVSTIVSSPGLDRLAALYGARLERTLTGFKWLGRPASNDPGFVFSYEEALGYCFALGANKPLLDKDGIAALTVFVAWVQRELAAQPASSPGQIVRARLHSLAVRIGLWVSLGYSVRLAGGPEAAAALMRKLRESELSQLGEWPVLSVRDLREGAAERPSYLGAQDLLVIELGPARPGGVCARVGVRPSGTEPKLKLYVHASSSFGEGDDYELVEAEVTREASALGATLAFWLSHSVAS